MPTVPHPAPPPSAAIRSLATQPGRMRLLCFPCAGAGASMYRPWAEPLARHGIEVVALQPPGREDRLGEAPVDELHVLVDALAQAMPPWLDRPFAMFGHSLGALLAFEVAKRLPLRGLPTPRLLIVSARRAPQLPLSHAPMHRMTRARLIDELRILGGTPQAVLDEEELMELFEPMLRADLKLTESYAPPDPGRITAPIVALAGAEDPRVTVPEVDAWRDATTDSCTLHVLGGGHFFIQPRQPEVLDLIHARLRSPATPSESFLQPHRPPITSNPS